MAEVRDPLHVMAMRNVVSFIVWAMALSPLALSAKGKVCYVRQRRSMGTSCCPNYLLMAC